MKHIILTLAVLAAHTFLFSMDSDPRIVANVTFMGNKEIPNSSLKKQIQLRKAFLFRRMDFDRRLLKLDAITLKNYYISKGYLQATVNDSFHIQDGEVDLFFQIDEGRRFYLHEVVIEGNEVIRDKTIASILGLQINQPFNPILLNQNRSLVFAEYDRHGKAFSRLELEKSISDSVQVTIQIEEGPDVYIQSVTVQGTQRVDSAYIRREFLFKVGDIFDKDRLDHTKKILLESGLFSSINIVSQVVPNSDSTLHLLVNVREYEKRGEVSIEPGYFPVQWSEGINELVGLGGYVEWLDRMVLGSTTRFSSRAAAVMPTEEGYRFPRFALDVKFSNPRPFPYWLVPFRIPTELRMFYQQFKNYGDEDGPYIRRFGLELTNVYRLKKRSFIELGLQWEGFNDFELYSDTTLTESAQVEQRKISLEIHLDNRDDPFYPKKGNMIILKLSSSGGILGGTRTFIKIEGDLRQYWTILGKVTLAGRINTGTITGWRDAYENYETFLFEKFYLGGSNTLRAWKPLLLLDHEVGGKQFPLGKTMKILTNWEVRFPLVWLLGGTFFTDGGTITDSYQDLTRSKFYWDYGLGINLNTPFGPVRLDFARYVEDKKIWQVHFGFMHAF